VIGEDRYVRRGDAMYDLNDLIDPADVASVSTVRGQEAMDKFGHERVVVITPRE